MQNHSYKKYILACLFGLFGLTIGTSSASASNMIEYTYGPKAGSPYNWIHWEISERTATGKGNLISLGDIGPIMTLCTSLRKNGYLFVADSYTTSSVPQVWVIKEEATTVTPLYLIGFPAPGGVSSCQLGATTKNLYYSNSKSTGVFAATYLKFPAAISPAPVAYAGPATSILSANNMVTINQVTATSGPNGASVILDVNNQRISSRNNTLLGEGLAGVDP